MLKLSGKFTYSYNLFTYISYLFTCFLTPWSRVLLEKLIGFQLVKKFSEFYGTRRFITAFTSASHLSLFRVRSIQSMPLHSTTWRSILILPYHLLLGLPCGIFPSRFPPKPELMFNKFFMYLQFILRLHFPYCLVFYLSLSESQSMFQDTDPIRYSQSVYIYNLMHQL